MDKNDTIIIVGATEKDQYGNLLVTPHGSTEKIRIGKKRENLHPLFEQGKAILLHWETYMNKTYVADAKLVEGEIPPPVKPAPGTMPPQEEIDKTKEAQKPEQHKSSPETGMWWKELGDMLRCGDIDKTKPFGKALRTVYYAEMLRVLHIEIKQKEV